MPGARAAAFVPWPKLVLLPLLLLLFHRTRPQGSLGPLQCYGVGPLGDLNCSWEPLGDLGTPSTLYLQSQKYHANKTWIVAVPTGQSWVTIPREQLTTADKLLVWAAKAGQPLWTPVFVNLETQSYRREWGYALCGVGCPGGPDSMHLGLHFCIEARCPPIVP